MATLTRAEKKWLDQLQNVLDACPSDRLGFYTTGDCALYLWNREASEAVYSRDEDFHDAVKHSRADFQEYLDFPAQIQSTAG